MGNPNRNQPTHSTGQKCKQNTKKTNKQIQKIQQTQKNTMAPGSIRTAHTTQTGTNLLTQLGRNANKIQKKQTNKYKKYNKHKKTPWHQAPSERPTQPKQEPTYSLNWAEMQTKYKKNKQTNTKNTTN